MPSHNDKSKLIWEKDFSPPESVLESLCLEPLLNWSPVDTYFNYNLIRNKFFSLTSFLFTYSNIKSFFIMIEFQITIVPTLMHKIGKMTLCTERNIHAKSIPMIKTFSQSISKILIINTFLSYTQFNNENCLCVCMCVLYLTAL